MESGIHVPLTRNPGSTARKSESKGSLLCRRSLGFVTRYCPVRWVGTRYCPVRGEGTRDEAPGTSALEVIPRAIRLFSTFAARFSNFVTLKKFTWGKSIRKMKVKPKDLSVCQLPLTRESRRTKECVTRNQTPEYQSCLGQSH